VARLLFKIAAPFLNGSNELTIAMYALLNKQATNARSMLRYMLLKPFFFFIFFVFMFMRKDTSMKKKSCGINLLCIDYQEEKNIPQFRFS
jgi:hypothetical protein